MSTTRTSTRSTTSSKRNAARVSASSSKKQKTASPVSASSVSAPSSSPSSDDDAYWSAINDEDIWTSPQPDGSETFDTEMWQAKTIGCYIAEYLLFSLSNPEMKLDFEEWKELTERSAMARKQFYVVKELRRLDTLQSDSNGLQRYISYAKTKIAEVTERNRDNSVFDAMTQEFPTVFDMFKDEFGVHLISSERALKLWIILKIAKYALEYKAQQTQDPQLLPVSFLDAFLNLEDNYDLVIERLSHFNVTEADFHGANFLKTNVLKIDIYGGILNNNGMSGAAKLMAIKRNLCKIENGNYLYASRAKLDRFITNFEERYPDWTSFYVPSDQLARHQAALKDMIQEWYRPKAEIRVQYPKNVALFRYLDLDDDEDGSNLIKASLQLIYDVSVKKLAENYKQELRSAGINIKTPLQAGTAKNAFDDVDATISDKVRELFNGLSQDDIENVCNETFNEISSHLEEIEKLTPNAGRIIGLTNDRLQTNFDIVKHDVDAFRARQPAYAAAERARMEQLSKRASGSPKNRRRPPPRATKSGSPNAHPLTTTEDLSALKELRKKLRLDDELLKSYKEAEKKKIASLRANPYANPLFKRRPSKNTSA